MKTVDLREGSKLLKLAGKIVGDLPYNKSDWEQDQPSMDKFYGLIEDLPEDQRLACILIMETREDVELAYRDSDFKNDLILNFGE